MKGRMKKIICAGLITVLVAASLAGCGGKKEGEPLKVGIMPASVGVPVQYAYDKGYFEEEGLKVELSIFQTGAPINEAIAAKQIDLAASGAATIFSLASGNCTLLAELCTSGGMGIYVRPDSDILSVQGELTDTPDVYGSAEVLKGKTVLGQLGTSAQLNVSKYMDKFGLTSDDYTMVHMDAGPAFQAFVAGEGDALAAYPPYSFNAQNEGMVQITTFEEATGFSIIDALFGRSEVIKERPEDIEKFVKCVIRADEELKDDALRSEYSMKFFKDNGREYSEQDMADEIAVRKYMGKDDFTDGTYSFGKCFTDQGEFYVENGKITEDQIPNLYSSLDPSYLNKALGIDIKPETK